MLRNESGTDDFLVLGTADIVPTDGMTSVKVAGEDILITRWRGTLYAFNRRCPHAAADLREGSIHRGRITCPDHGYKFDIGTGRAVWPEDEVCRLKRYLVKEEAGIVKVKIR